MAQRRWAPGTSYGPVLTPTELYLLEGKLELHPILKNQCKDFHLDFDMATGRTGDFEQDLQFTMKDEAATLPRITEIVIIARQSPWCTIVRKDIGVTLGDVCATLWKDYMEHPLTETEFGTLSKHEQEKVRRIAMQRESGAMGTVSLSAMWNPTAMSVSRLKRIDWLRGKTMFDGLEQDDAYVKKRLAFAAPNVFILDVSS